MKLQIMVTLLLCAGCAGITQQPVETVIFDGDYVRLSDCSFARLSAVHAATIKKADLPSSGTVRLDYENGDKLLIWTLTFTREDSNRTRVHLTGINTLQGPDTSLVAPVMPTVRACASV